MSDNVRNELTQALAHLRAAENLLPLDSPLYGVIFRAKVLIGELEKTTDFPTSHAPAGSETDPNG